MFQQQIHVDKTDFFVAIQSSSPGMIHRYNKRHLRGRAIMNCHSISYFNHYFIHPIDKKWMLFINWNSTVEFPIFVSFVVTHYLWNVTVLVNKSQIDLLHPFQSSPRMLGLNPIDFTETPRNQNPGAEIQESFLANWMFVVTPQMQENPQILATCPCKNPNPMSTGYPWIE